MIEGYEKVGMAALANVMEEYILSQESDHIENDLEECCLDCCNKCNKECI